MKRLGWLALCVMALTWQTASAAEPFQSGKHYYELPVPQPVETGAKIELREFFWYGCPHCYALEPVLVAFVKTLPPNVKFVRTPGTSPNWLMQAQAYYTFEVLGVTDKLHKPLFDDWHLKNRHVETEDDLADFAAEHGVNKAKFKDAFASFSVHTRLERAKRENMAFMIDGVPALAVDGRYVTSPSMAGGEAAAMQVLEFLIAKAAAERKKAPAGR